MKVKKNTSSLEETVMTLFSDGDVMEVRILGTKKGTVSGYFNDPVALASSVGCQYAHENVYITLNPVSEKLLARSNNRLKQYVKQTTSDSEITSLRHILIDIDPVRPAGISASKAERAHAKKVVGDILIGLDMESFPKPIVAMSGNGYHLLLNIEMENSLENVDLIKKFLEVLDFRYSTEHAHVDRTTFNPARIVRLYGTRACKGDDTEERPHRMSKIIEVPQTSKKVTAEQLKKFIESALPSPQKILKETGDAERVNVASFLAENGIQVRHTAPYNGGNKFILEECPWNPDHKNGSAFVIEFGGGKIAAGCLHNSCRQENWRTLQERLGIDVVLKPQITEREEKHADIIVDIAGEGEFFCSELGESFVRFPVNDHFEVVPVKSKRFRLLMSKLFHEKTRTISSADAMNQALTLLEAIPQFKDVVLPIERRVGLTFSPKFVPS